MVSGKSLAVRSLVFMTLALVGWLIGDGLYAQSASNGNYDFMPGEVLVKFKAGISPTQIAALNQKVGGKIIGTFRGDPSLYHIQVPESLRMESVVSYYNNDDSVEYAEHNIIYYTEAIPNDPRFSSQYALARIQAAGAWDFFVGDYSVVLDDTDTGIDYTHPDLWQNIWYNPNEIWRGWYR